MIMVELDSGGQMPYTPREAAQIAHDWLVKNGVTMKAVRARPRGRTAAVSQCAAIRRFHVCPLSETLLRPTNFIA